MTGIGRKFIRYIPDISELLPLREYRCKFQCGKVFKNRVPYEMHLQRKHGEEAFENVQKLFKCPVESCHYLAIRLCLVRRHYQCNHMEKKFKCEKCGRKFPVESQFVKHRCERQRYMCQVCPRTFPLLGMRNKHVRQCIANMENLSMNMNMNHLGNDNEKISTLTFSPCMSPSEIDDITVEEFEELIRNIENKTINNPGLNNELAELTPILEYMQSLDD